MESEKYTIEQAVEHLHNDGAIDYEKYKPSKSVKLLRKIIKIAYPLDRTIPTGNFRYYYSIDGFDWTCCDETNKKIMKLSQINETRIPEPTLTNEGPIQSPDADNTERGEIEASKLVDYIFEFAFEWGRLWETKLSEEQKLERIGEKLQLPYEVVEKIFNNPTPPTLLNELRDLNVKYIKWANNIEQVGDIEERPVLKREIAVLKGMASDLDAIIQKHEKK